MSSEPGEQLAAASPARPDVTIVVVPREQFGVSGRALETLYERTDYAFSLVYVDAGSPRATQRRLASEARRRGFALIRTDHYLTPNRARNLGLAHVKSGKYVVFLDNDVLVGPGWLGALVRCAEETGAAVVGPVTCIGEPEGQIVHSAGGLAHIDDRSGVRRFVHENHFENSRLDAVRPVLHRGATELVEFHCVLIRTDVLARIGPLDEAILNDPHHVDLCMVVREAGGHVYLEPASVVTQLAPPPVPWSDLAFFLQRWNGPATRRSLRHFTRKWQIRPDDPAIQRLAEWLLHRKHLAFRGLYTAVERLVGWRIGQTIRQICLFPLEAAVSSALFHALHRARREG
ncbi:MAG TPA: glycosyltransferase [Methylomirabilota bacterium]|jgi:GT2 family glycosyltransferase|nr:glycosyltransferase [Methylomirabilota bacterium]